MWELSQGLLLAPLLIKQSLAVKVVTIRKSPSVKRGINTLLVQSAAVVHQV